MDKEVRQLLDSIRQVPGVTVKHGSKHVRVYLDGASVATLPQSPSDHRWRGNAIAHLRRVGILPAGVPTRRKESEVTAELMPMEELRARVAALPNRAEFARFIMNVMPGLEPELRIFKTVDSAESSIHQFATKRPGSGALREWTHVLLDHSVRQWDARHAGNGTAPVITDAELDEAIAIDQAATAPDTPPEVIEDMEREASAEVQPEPSLAYLSFVDLARDHDELTERIDAMAERVRSLGAQLDELVARRDAVSAEILGRLKEGRPA